MEELKERIRQVVAARGSRPIKIAEMLKALDLPPTDRKRLRRLLREMASEGELARLRGQQFVVPHHATSLVGVLHVSSKGFGFVIPEEQYIVGQERQDIFIPRKRMGDALHNDMVMVRIVGKTAKSPEGEIVEVVERRTHELVGTFYFTKKGGNVIPRDERFNRSVLVPRPDPSLGIDNGSYVVAEVTTWTPATQPLLGRVREALGDPETPGIDITMIIRDAGVDTQFPEDVLSQTEVIESALPAEELLRRQDYRSLTTFTMDGINAKDFDDALSIERTPEGMWRLGVHIADVGHYVHEASRLDLEAYSRATSIYPVDRVVPMLPEKLSNDLCSLRPSEDRLTLSCMMEIDEDGRVHDYSINEAIIRSTHRLVYEDVQALMDGTAEPATVRAIGDIRPQMEELYALRRVLTAMRIQRGALELDIPETAVELDPEGKPKALVRRERLESHRVVEECMLIANEVVASHLFNLHVPSVYRVHEAPDLFKLRQLSPVLGHMGVRFPGKHDITPEAIQKALDKVSESETGFIARRLILRAMMRAHYTDENLGHYGLASSCYTHFTSPIRRYPDLLVHRILKECARNGASMSGIYTPPGQLPAEHGEVAGRPRRSRSLTPPLPERRVAQLSQHLPTWTKHCSEQERRAEEIERNATQVKALEYMRGHLGEEFDGFVTSVLDWGFFVELKSMPIEGLVHVRSLRQDFFEYDEEHMTLVGKETGETFKLGDRVRVAVANVNITALELDFALLEKHDAVRATAKKQRELQQRRRQRQLSQAQRHPRTGGFQSRARRRR